jgi:hypothetical protein
MMQSLVGIRAGLLDRLWALPEPMKIGGVRVGALIWSTVLFGVLSVPTVWQQLGRHFG